MSKIFEEGRAGQLRASEICVLMGVQGYDGRIAHDLYLKLKKGVDFEPTKPFTDDEEEFESESDDLRRGNIYEPFALQFAARDLELTVDFAKNKDDGILRFSRRHPKYDFMGGMPDCVFEDGWIGEAKCPRPHVLRKQLEEGPYEKFIWQMTMQLLCYPEAPGVRFILYDCVACRSFVYELPREIMKTKELEQRCVKFYTDHIIGDKPFVQADWDKPVPVPPVNPLKQSDYEPMTGPAWTEVARRFAEAKGNCNDADFQLDAAKQLIVNSAQAVGLEKIDVNGHKFIVRMVTRNSLDKRSLKEDYPKLELKDYHRPGKPFLEVRYYPPARLKK